MVQSNLAKRRLSLRELRSRIAVLKALHLQRADLEYLKKQLVPILHHYVHPAPLIQPGERIFRAVLWPEKPRLKGQLGYPPAEFVTTYGRANRPGEPIFYGSVGSTATIQELAPATGARMVLSMWRVTTPMMVVSVGYSEDAFGRLGSDRWSKIWWRREHGIEPVGFQTPENKLLDNFLAKEFTRRVPRNQGWQHKLSVAVSETYLNSKSRSFKGIAGLHVAGVTRPGEAIAGLEVAGLVYPSIATGGNDDNVALKCANADACLELAWVQYIQIDRVTDKADEFTPKGLDFADSVSASGEINWLGVFPNARCAGTDYRADVDGKRLVLKDSLGHIIGHFPEGSAG